MGSLAAEFREGAAADADLVLFQSAGSFVMTMKCMPDPDALSQAGEFQVNDFEALTTFGQLLPIS